MVGERHPNPLCRSGHASRGFLRQRGESTSRTLRNPAHIPAQAESRANLESIVPFLTMFPSLRILTFSGFLLLSDECDPAAPIPPGSFSDFVQREERLAELLEDIQHSSLVELNYRTSIKSKRELRLRREGPGKEWDGEWWTV